MLSRVIHTRAIGSSVLSLTKRNILNKTRNSLILGRNSTDIINFYSSSSSNKKLNTNSNFIKKGKITDDDNLNFDEDEFFSDSNSSKNKLSDNLKEIQINKELTNNLENSNLKKDFNWLEVFNNGSKNNNNNNKSNNSDFKLSNRIEIFKSKFLNLSNQNNLEKLKIDIFKSIIPYMTKFVDNFLKDEFTNDPTFNELLKNDKNAAYIYSIVQFIKSSTELDIIEQRFKVQRLNDIDQNLYKSFKTELDKIDNEEYEEDSNNNNNNNNLNKFDINLLLDQYFKFPQPRSLRILSDDLEKFLNILNNNYIEKIYKFNSNEVSTIYSDVLESGMSLTPNEYSTWLQLSLGNIEFNTEMYDNLTKSLPEAGVNLNLDHYNIFLTASLEARNFTLFDKILNDMFYKLEFEPDRYTLGLMNNYCGYTKDLNKWLNLWDLRMNNYNYCLQEMDLRGMIATLIELNQVDAAKSILHTILLTEEYYKEFSTNSLSTSQSQQQQQQQYENESIVSDEEFKEIIPYEHPMEIYDLVVDDQKLLMYFIHPTALIFEPFFQSAESYKEIKDLMKIMETNGDINLNLDCFYGIFQVIKYELDTFIMKNENFESTQLNVSFSEFQKIITKILTNNEIYINYLFDQIILNNFIKIIENYIQIGEIDGNDEKFINSLKILWNFIENSQHEELTESKVTDLISSIIILSKLDDN
ncbi:hypothetical protein B5S31_g3036 [[Candida] boidinii]|nr:hypothetical protein B5S31_g3036 [[Candida] boidinii]